MSTNTIERWSDKRLSPFRELSLMQSSFDRMLNEIENMRRGTIMPEFGFTPSCDISEDEKSYLLKFDLPGVTKDQVRVNADKDVLTVHAERNEEKKSETKKRYLSEVNYGSYTRSFTMPGPVDEKKIDAKFENGVLTVLVPKTEMSKAKQIPIH